MRIDSCATSADGVNLHMSTSGHMQIVLKVNNSVQVNRFPCCQILHVPTVKISFGILFAILSLVENGIWRCPQVYFGKFVSSFCSLSINIISEWVRINWFAVRYSWKLLEIFRELVRVRKEPLDSHNNFSL